MESARQFLGLGLPAEEDGGFVLDEGVQARDRLITDTEEVRILAARYGSIRGQALSPHESLALIEQLLGEA